MTPQEEIRKSVHEIIGEAEQLIAENGGPFGQRALHEALARCVDDDGVTGLEVYGSALNLIAGLAALVGADGIHLYNTESERWLHITMDNQPPEGIEGEMMGLDGTPYGFVKDGVLVNHDGVEVVAEGPTCRICGQEGCTDTSCNRRRQMLAAVRNMGRAVPQEPGTLPDVDAKGVEG